MGNILLSLAGMALAVVMVKYRESFAEIFGEAEWMRNIGGVYNVILVTAGLIFFFSLAKLTGTTDLFLAPLMWLFNPGEAAIEPTF